MDSVEHKFKLLYIFYKTAETINSRNTQFNQKLNILNIIFLMININNCLKTIQICFCTQN